MSDESPDNADDAVRLQRPPPRVLTDPLGHNVWMGEVQPLDLELEQVTVTDPYNTAPAETAWQRP